MGGGKRLFRFFYQTSRLKTFIITLANLDNSVNALQIKPINLNVKRTLAES